MNRTTKRAGIVAVLCAVAGLQVWALNLEPLSVRFRPTGRDSIQTFRVSNTQDENIAVRIRMSTRELQTNGDELRHPADADFMIFPTHVFLAPGQTQAVRVQWRGGASVQREQAYRIIVEQVAVSDDFRSRSEGGDSGESASLRFMYRYIGAVYVTPEGARPNIVLSGHELVEYRRDDRSEWVLSLEFVNQGTGHVLVDAAEVDIRGRTETGETVRYELNSEQLQTIVGVNFLAGARLVQLIHLPQNLVEDSIEVGFNLTLSR